MKLNQDVVLSLSACPAILVPYEKQHVEQYHRWMQAPELLELTASEPLTLDEEYENMKSWREDEGKMTFIILDRSIEHAMAGDVNLYLLEDSDDGERVAEIEVMIAERRSRRKGIAKNALLMMMAYAVEHLQIQIFVAKILEHNEPSINLFSNALDFEEERRVPAFGEIHYRQRVGEELKNTLAAVRNAWTVESFASAPFSKLALQTDRST